MKKSIYQLAILTFTLLLVSCKNNGNDEILDITTDKTLAIVKLNLEDLEKKIPSDKILNDTAKATFSKKDKEKAELFFDAEKNGIDIDKPLFVLVDSDKNSLISSFVLWLSDKDLFQKNFSKITEKTVKIDGKNYLYVGDKLIGSVKDDMLIMSASMDNPLTSFYGGYSSGPQNVSETFYKDFWLRKKIENEDVEEQIDQALKKDMDMSTWLNIQGFASLASKGYIETLAINKLLIGSSIGMNLNFEAGQIVLNTETYFNEEMKKIVDKYYKDKGINYDILKSVDIDKAKSYLIGYFSLDFLKYFIKEAGFEATINNVLASRDMSVDDIVNGFTGDYAFITYGDIKKQVYNEYFDYTYEQVTPNYALVFGKNGTKGTKIVDQFRNDFSLKDNIFYTNKDLFVMGNDAKTFDLLQNKKTATNKKLEKKSGITTYSWSNGADFNVAMLRGKSPSKAKIVNIISESKMDNGNTTSKIVVTLDKKDKNALVYLMGYE